MGANSKIHDYSYFKSVVLSHVKIKEDDSKEVRILDLWSDFKQHFIEEVGEDMSEAQVQDELMVWLRAEMRFKNIEDDGIEWHERTVKKTKLVDQIREAANYGVLSVGGRLSHSSEEKGIAYYTHPNFQGMLGKVIWAKDVGILMNYIQDFLEDMRMNGASVDDQRIISTMSDHVYNPMTSAIYCASHYERGAIEIMY